MLNRIAPALMNSRIAVGFVFAMVLIVSGFVISFYSYRQYGRATERVKHTYEVIEALQSTSSLLSDVQAGARGFVITNDSIYLDSYKKAVLQLPAQLKKLYELVRDHRVQKHRVEVLEQKINEKLASTPFRFGPSVADRINALNLSRQDKRRMDHIRQQIAIMIETEESLMEVRNRQVQNSFRNTLIIIFILSLLTFVTLIISYRILEKELLRRQQTADQLRAYEVRLKEQIRQLQSSNEELERFAFVASHDLQEPLRKIQSFSDLVTDRYSNLFDDNSRMYMAKISKSAERMSKLIKDLLNFSRISTQQEEFRPVLLDEVIQRVLDDQELRIRGMEVRVDMGPMPIIQAVSSQMDHLFTNLISNALKFVRTDVQPMLRISATPVDGSAYPELTPGRRYYEIIVEDNGIGFDVKYLDHIFKVFQRLHGKSEFEGTGIGLAICKRVVVNHQGLITARSQPNQGTAFVIVLPESHSLHDYDRTNSTEAYSHITG